MRQSKHLAGKGLCAHLRVPWYTIQKHFLYLHMLTPIDIQLVRPSDSGELLALSRKTFYDAFEHVNNPDDFEAYTSVAFTA